MREDIYIEGKVRLYESIRCNTMSYSSVSEIDVRFPAETYSVSQLLKLEKNVP
jgi:hypothetical protein